MKALLNVLRKGVVNRYYREQLGLFLVWFGVAFGILSSTEHLALAQFFTAAPAMMLYPMAFWLAYTLYVIRYLVRMLSLREYQFLTQALRTYSPRKQRLALRLIMLGCLLPVTLYGIFMMAVGMEAYGHWWILALGLALGSWHSLGVWVLNYRLKNPEGWQWAQRGHRKSRPLWQWSFLFFQKEQTWLTLGTKIFTVLMLVGTSAYAQAESYDLRAYGLGIWVILLAHVPLFNALQTFFQERLGWLFNLPYPWWKRIFQLSILVFALWLPEAIVWIRMERVNLSASEWWEGFLLGSLGLLGLYLYSYRWPTDLSFRMGRLFRWLIAGTVFIMYGVPLWLVSVVLLTLGVLMAWRYFTFRHWPE
ncbi:MAG TPA: hypothetical protein DCE41_32815 [Cytophagales bacterium]|nr:hypothetical protein [Cytophagales bacterium]HAA17321.1 hypothetical protein [Cytophagales bacterium]HAP62982.1 hypothetical protein [Cytophagales bacterium]